MKRSIALAFATAMFIGSQPAARGDKPSPVKHLQFNLRVLEGDPLGSQEAGTLKVLAEPRIVTVENREFFLQLGGEIAIPDGANGVQLVKHGLMIEGKPGNVKDGKVRLDITLSNNKAGEGGEGLTQLHTESTRTITAVRIGEVIKLRWDKAGAECQTWAELCVEEVNP